MKTGTPWLRGALVSALAVAFFGTTFLLTSEFLATAPAVQFDSRPPNGTETQILAIFVASSTCGASEFLGLREALDNIRQTLKVDAVRDEKRFVSIGVSLDQDPWRGTEFLKTFGPFDEILSGESWLNTGALTFMLRDFPGPRVIPQLILVEREVEHSDQGILSVNDRVVGRKIGGAGIVNFDRTISD